MKKKVNIVTSKKVKPEADKWAGARVYKRLTVDLPPDLHKNFHTLASSQGRKMRHIILKWIQEFVHTEKQK